MFENAGMGKIVFIFFIVGELFSQSVKAQTCCSGGVPLANNIGGLPLSAKGTWQFSLSADVNLLKTLKAGSSTLEDNSRERKTVSALLKTSYSFTDKVFVEGLFSWVLQERYIEQVGGFEDFDRTQGIGDWVVVLNGKYLETNGWTLIAGAGPKLPTGQSDLKDENGLTLNADLQPGSGAWDGIFIHRIIKTDQTRKTRSYFMNLTFRATGKNNNYLNGQTYQFGNEWQVLVGASDQATLRRSLLSYGINLRYRVATQDLFNDEVLPNTGGNFLYIMPSVGWYIKPDIILSLNTEIPVYTRVEGTQLAPSFRINGGIYISIGKK
jgi:hypothetical protein